MHKLQIKRKEKYIHCLSSYIRADKSITYYVVPKIKKKKMKIISAAADIPVLA